MVFFLLSNGHGHPSTKIIKKGQKNNNFIVNEATHVWITAATATDIIPLHIGFDRK